jgi:subtilisin-like proprotein convertase family protein
VAFDGVLAPTSATLAIPTGRPAATETAFAYTGPPVPIPDDDPAGASVAIPVSGIGFAAGLRFSVDGATCSAADDATGVGLFHTYVSDLVGTLTSPHGTTVTLFDRAGGGGNHLCQVVFDDAAPEPFASVLAAQAPFTGTWRPDQPLAPLLDRSVDGDWTFTVVDAGPLDVGTIDAVSVLVRGMEG